MNHGGSDDTTPWKLLVVDDNEDVHLATELALENERILGRSLSFLHAYTPEEARAILGREGEDIAVVLLDVVVANELAGLGLVRHIRDELGLHEVRIVLRTDQARYAPETEVIRDYDINDYRFKSELSTARLYATITAAVRAYHQIHQLGIARRGLERIVRASGQCVLQQDYRGFAAGLMDMMADLLEMPLQGVVCERKWPRAGEPEPPATILAARTRHSAELGRRIDQVEDAPLRNALLRVLHTRQNLIEAHTASLYLPGSRDCDLLVHLEADRTLSEVDRALLEVLGTNAALCFQNVLNVSRLRDYAFRDPLLDLPNQLALAQIIDEHCRHPHASAATLCLLEIDHFEQFRNALGQGFGDRLLAAVHQRIRNHLDPRVTIARVGNDSFGLFGPEASIDPNNILSCFHRPLPIDESEHTIAVSLGLVRLGEIGHGQGSDAMQSANIALEHAKLTRRADYSYFSAQMEADIKDRVQLLQDLRRAVKEERLFLVYQPQIDLAHGRPVGAEALLRWRDEQGQFISPARFIPVAESSRLIVSLGEWVLRMACEDLGRILDSGMDRFRMAVNVSLAQFGHPLFLERVDAILTETGVPAANLELEITESMAMLELDYVVQTLAALKRRGITVAVDDFGTGFSSLSYLERLKLDRLKLDQYFVRQSALSPDCAHIAETIVELGRRLNLVVIAEGVDQPDQITWLRGLGCHEAQGFHIARPMPAADLMDWLRTRT